MLLLVRIQQWEEEVHKTETRFAQLLSNLHEQIRGESVSFELVSYRQHVYFYLHIQDHLHELILGQIYALYHDCVIEEQFQDYATPEAVKNGTLVMTELKTKRSDLYPIKRFTEFEGDSLAGLFTVMSKAGEGQTVWAQVVMTPRVDDFLFNIRRTFKFFMNRIRRWFRLRDRVKARAQGEFRKEEFEAIRLKTSERQWRTAIRLAAFAPDAARAESQLHALVQAYAQFNTVDHNGFAAKGKIRGAAALKEWQKRSGGGFLLGISEAAGIYHYPDPDIVPHIVHVMARRSEPPLDLPKAGDPDVIPFGTTNYHNEQVPFGMLRVDRARHLYVVGKSGTGKSRLLELLIASDIKDGKGVCVMDPHGDLVDAVIKHVPEHRVKDVIYFNPMDTEFPVAFNPMQAVSPELKLRVTIGFIEIFKKLFGANWTPRLEHVLRQTTLALLDSKGTTVFSILKMLSDKNYRQTIVSRIEDSVVKNFWVNEFAAWSEKFDNEAITPLLNKVGQLVSTNLIRNIIGQPFNTFDIRKIMDGQKIFLVKLNKGLLGEENAALLGAMMITKIQQAALERADMPEADRKAFYLYCDEFQYFATDTFAEILSEARKYKLSLTIAHQYMGQLSDLVRTTVFGNIGTIIAFRVGAEDAGILEQEFTPVFKVRDIINLAVREFYIKMSVQGQTRDTFSAMTMDCESPKQDFVKQIVEHSRETFAKPRKDVEVLLRKWDESGGDVTQEDWYSGALDEEFAPPIV
ncbi:MAG TPA: type IV secretory system conjugative DNA transfer family protein [Candidatus Peribacterales bacterium]|nr:type IV secretory system conjugative DNA transfer family protein [Candidatus Peribacterales bacterium]